MGRTLRRGGGGGGVSRWRSLSPSDQNSAHWGTGNSSTFLTYFSRIIVTKTARPFRPRRGRGCKGQQLKGVEEREVETHGLDQTPRKRHRRWTRVPFNLNWTSYFNVIPNQQQEGHERTIALAAGGGGWAKKEGVGVDWKPTKADSRHHRHQLETSLLGRTTDTHLELIWLFVVYE